MPFHLIQQVEVYRDEDSIYHFFIQVSKDFENAYGQYKMLQCDVLRHFSLLEEPIKRIGITAKFPIHQHNRLMIPPYLYRSYSILAGEFIEIRVDEVRKNIISWIPCFPGRTVEHNPFYIK